VWRPPGLRRGSSRCDPSVGGDDLDLCGDALYLKLTGMTSEELFPEMWDMADA